MTTTITLPSLSSSTVDKLKTLRAEDREAFYAYVYALRQAEWPLRAIADPFGVSRTAASQWEKKYKKGTPLPSVEPLPLLPVKERRNGAKSYTLTESEANELARLTREASTVRRFTDPNASSRQSAAELETLLDLYRQKGASKTHLANVCGVSRSAVAQRLRKKDQ